MTITVPPEFDSKFRFILVAAQRAKQLQNGAPAKIETTSSKATRIAIKETELNLIQYEILEDPPAEG
jgi:DNA-directed RNA polymerase subunit omega